MHVPKAIKESVDIMLQTKLDCPELPFALEDHKKIRKLLEHEPHLLELQSLISLCAGHTPKGILGRLKLVASSLGLGRKAELLQRQDNGMLLSGTRSDV
ncbi:hypothetical protein CKAN_02764500 [Cinnamomum micranthum f. kanehirae]|uniref:Uncharacterized protein n=1 Tax=Cinnamomum micranthum f. kanehirae TaxID=337451 RepID=A0A443Q548_9MAGN|nr:hypothetical protein CKAN_02764500 [Cinnamomum micranthum f. kanehirae]